MKLFLCEIQKYKIKSTKNKTKQNNDKYNEHLINIVATNGCLTQWMVSSVIAETSVDVRHVCTMCARIEIELKNVKT